MDDTNTTGGNRSEAASDDRYRRIEDLVTGMEQDVAARKKRREKPAPKLEPVYMTLFIGFMIAALGGMEGYMRHKYEALDVLGRMPEGKLFDRVLYDINGVIFGFGHHIREFWMMDAAFFGLGLLAFFGLREPKPRRRAFSSLAAIVVLAYTALMVTSMFDFTGGIRLRT